MAVYDKNFLNRL